MMKKHKIIFVVLMMFVLSVRLKITDSTIKQTDNMTNENDKRVELIKQYSVNMYGESLTLCER